MSGIAKVKEDGQFVFGGAAGVATIDYHAGDLWKFNQTKSGANMLDVESGDGIHLEMTIQKFYNVFDVVEKG